MPKHPYNEEFRHPNVVHYDGTNIDVVRKALVAAFERDTKEHWRDRYDGDLSDLSA